MSHREVACGAHRRRAARGAHDNSCFGGATSSKWRQRRRKVENMLAAQLAARSARRGMAVVAGWYIGEIMARHRRGMKRNENAAALLASSWWA